MSLYFKKVSDTVKVRGFSIYVITPNDAGPVATDDLDGLIAALEDGESFEKFVSNSATATENTLTLVGTCVYGDDDDDDGESVDTVFIERVKKSLSNAEVGVLWDGKYSARVENILRSRLARSTRVVGIIVPPFLADGWWRSLRTLFSRVEWHNCVLATEGSHELLN